jgi:hypothetical protein
LVKVVVVLEKDEKEMMDLDESSKPEQVKGRRDFRKGHIASREP